MEQTIKELLSSLNQMPKGNPPISEISTTHLRDCVIWFKNVAERTLAKQPHSFQFTESNQDIIIEMIKYFTNHKSILTQQKAIGLHGERGVGKSLLMQIFSTFTAEYYMNKTVDKGFRKPFYKNILAEKIGTDYENTNIGIKVFDQFNMDFCIHDILREKEFYKNYDKELNVIQYLIDNVYYENCQYKGWRLYYTMNGNKELIYGRYDKRTADCLIQNTTTIVLTGKNFRIP